MASAAVQNAQIPTHFCHRCSRSIVPLRMPELNCPRCQDAFIEEIRSELLDNARISESRRPDNVMLIDESRSDLLNEAAGGGFEEGNQSQRNANAGSSRSEGLRGRIEVEISAQLDAPRDSGAGQSASTVDNVHRHFVFRLGGSGSERENRADIDTVSERRARARILHANVRRLIEATIARRQELSALAPSAHNEMVTNQDVRSLEDFITSWSRAAPMRDNAISQLPTIRVSQELLNGTPSCVVCLEAYALDEELRQLPCEHGFHDDCIERWLKQSASCPICRDNVGERLGITRSHGDLARLAMLGDPLMLLPVGGVNAAVRPASADANPVPRARSASFGHSASGRQPADDNDMDLIDWGSPDSADDDVEVIAVRYHTGLPAASSSTNTVSSSATSATAANTARSSRAAAASSSPLDRHGDLAVVREIAGLSIGAQSRIPIPSATSGTRSSVSARQRPNDTGPLRNPRLPSRRVVEGPNSLRSRLMALRSAATQGTANSAAGSANATRVNRSNSSATGSTSTVATDMISTRGSHRLQHAPYTARRLAHGETRALNADPSTSRIEGNQEEDDEHN